MRHYGNNHTHTVCVKHNDKLLVPVNTVERTQRTIVYFLLGGRRGGEGKGGQEGTFLNAFQP